jgi:hypothetical protein
MGQFKPDRVVDENLGTSLFSGIKQKANSKAIDRTNTVKIKQQTKKSSASNTETEPLI